MKCAIWYESCAWVMFVTKFTYRTTQKAVTFYDRWQVLRMKVRTKQKEELSYDLFINIMHANITQSTVNNRYFSSRYAPYVLLRLLSLPHPCLLPAPMSPISSRTLPICTTSPTTQARKAARARRLRLRLRERLAAMAVATLVRRVLGRYRHHRGCLVLRNASVWRDLVCGNALEGTK
jgi:hypothetical protein